MTTGAWLVVAALVLLVTPGSTVSRRAAGLARSGRLARVDPPAPKPRGRVPFDGASRGVAALAGALGALPVALLAGPALGLAAGAVVATGWRLTARLLATRAAARQEEQTARALRLVLAELTAGSAVGTALAAAGELGGAPTGPLAASAVLAGQGADPSGPLLAAGGALAGAGHALRVADVTGAAPSDVLARVVEELVAARAQRRAAAVALAGPRSSAGLLAGLPLLGVVLGTAMGADPLGFLLTAPAGRVVCAAGVLLDVAGVWWVAAVLRRAERG